MKTKPVPRVAQKRNAAETKSRILKAAKGIFSRHGYEHGGVREIAAAAGVDAALVNRYFGSKKNLFKETLTGSFTVPSLSNNAEEFVNLLLQHIYTHHKDIKKTGSAEDLDHLNIVLKSAVSPVASSIVSKIFHDEFVNALANRLPGEDKQLRASMVSAFMIGFGIMFEALNSPAMAEAELEKTIHYLSCGIKACIESVN